MHAPSVGEGLQARPVLEILRRERPDVQLAYTYFSPSAESFASGLDVDFRDYLPFDTQADARESLAQLRPNALVFSKLDVWPQLALTASQANVALGLISATVAPGSARLRQPVRWMLRPAYATLDRVGAIAADHGERLIRMGVRPSALRITGDTRYDQVWARALAVDARSPLLKPLASDRPTLVAGSTWPPDETVLMDAWDIVRRAVPRARLIIAPHEPSAGHVVALENGIRERGWRSARLSATASSVDVIIVDRLGALGELYALATAAYVGGGFHDAGLHSVLEPAAFGAPVAFGPRFKNSRDAERLATAGGGVSASTPEALAHYLIAWLSKPADRAKDGARARAVVEDELGAAQRAADLVFELLGRTRLVATRSTEADSPLCRIGRCR
jgi:3-deoxy-D-manno-octulosonic-acid transferase